MKVSVMAHRLDAPQTGGEYYMRQLARCLGVSFNVSVTRPFPGARLGVIGKIIQNAAQAVRLGIAKPDWVIIDGFCRPQVFLALPLLRRVLDLKAVGVIQDLYLAGKNGRPARRSAGWVRDIFLRSLDLAVVNSGWMAQQVRSRGVPDDRILVIPPSLDEGLARQASVTDDAGRRETDPLRLLTIAHIKPLKGLATAVKALKRLEDLDPTWTIVGAEKDSDHAGYLKRLASSLGVEKKMVFMGEIPREGLGTICRAASIFVMPSKYEAFGLAAFEAMAFGLPVIASDVGGLSALVRQSGAGLLVPVGDDEALASAIRRLSRDGGMIRRLSENGRSYALGTPRWEEGAAVLASRLQAIGGRKNFRFRHVYPLVAAAIGRWGWKKRLRPSPMRKAIIFRTGSIGDAVTLIPALQALRERQPGVSLTLVASRLGRETLHGEGLVDDFIVMPEGGLSCLNRRGKRKWAAQFDPDGFDVAVLTGQEIDLWYRLAARRSSRWVIGFRGGDGGALVDSSIEEDPRLHEAARVASLFRELGVGVIEAPMPSLSRRPREEILSVAAKINLPAEGPVVVVHPCGKRGTRGWREDGFAELIDGLAGAASAFVLTGSGKDEEVADRIAVRVTSPVTVINAAGCLTVKDMKALLSRARLLISVDTGVMHLGVALRTPTVALFGPGDYPKWGYEGAPFFRAVRHPTECSPCYLERCASRACMARIRPDEVSRAALALLDVPSSGTQGGQRET